MRAKHLYVTAHADLYKSIYNQIQEKLPMDKRKANRYFVLKGLFYFSLAITSYILIYTISNPIAFILNFVLFGFIAVLLCFNFAHDLSHHSIFKHPFWDNLFFEFIYTLVGAHPEAWKKRHINSHHIAPNVANFDTDLAITGLIRVLPQGSRKWYHKYQYLYAPFAYMSYSFYWVFMKDFIVLKQFAPKSKKQRIRYLVTFITLKSFYLFYLLIFPMLYSLQSIWVVLTAFLVMHMVQSLYTLFTFFITHHVSGANYPKANSEGLINMSWFMNQIKSSNDFYPFSNVANFIFGGVNNHVAHHLFPHISHYHYPKLNRILYDTLLKNNIIPNQTTYLGGVISHLKLLKKRGVQN
ncbi:fatty acid desaturase [uncultured Maribacter sp.]|uniref:fatty acid desaturase family protein n=1 Tax=uncultured Maribacter sp. TaxID=431308 RepID=UPI0030D958EB|tara:strand:- start:2251 stop:3309 length:1059 start_codon:yes stop_codon:yes gene_type:complete